MEGNGSEIKMKQPKVLDNKKQNIYCLLGFLLLCLTLVFSGCEKQNNNAIKVIDPTGSKTEPLVKENDSVIQADDSAGGNNESVISGEQGF